MEANNEHSDGRMAAPPFWLYWVCYSVCSPSPRVRARLELLVQGVLRLSNLALGIRISNTCAQYIIVTPNNLTAASLVIQYWLPREKVNPGVFIAVFLVCIVFINYFGVRFFGELEFWLSGVKVLVILGLILLSLILACGGGPDHHATGFQFWNNPGAFHEYITTGAEGRFLAVYSTFTTAVFAYLGTELVGVTVGEAANPRKAIPRAIKLTFFRILIFYVVLVFLLGMLVPYNSNKLLAANKSSASAAASPFVVAIEISGIKVLPGLFNACVLIFVFSAANSDLYIASRTLYGLAHEGKAPRIFKRTDARGVPIFALALSAAFCLLAFLGVKTSSYTVFGYFVNLVTIFGLLTWISILISHICFVRARRAQNIPDSALAFVAPLGMWGSVGALGFSIIIAFFKGFALFCYKATTAAGKTPRFDTSTFVTTYLGIPLYFIMFFGYKFVMKAHWVKPKTADLYSGKARIDAEEEEFLAKEQARKGMPETKAERIYRLTIGWAF
jgi:amino acid transporter